MRDVIHENVSTYSAIPIRISAGKHGCGHLFNGSQGRNGLRNANVKGLNVPYQKQYEPHQITS